MKKVSSGITIISRKWLISLFTYFEIQCVVFLKVHRASVSCTTALLFTVVFILHVLRECCPWAAKQGEKVRASLEFKNFPFRFLGRAGKATLNRKRMLCHNTVNILCREGELIRKELEPLADRFMIHEANQFCGLSLLLLQTGQQLDPTLGNETFAAWHVSSVVPTWKRKVTLAYFCSSKVTITSSSSCKASVGFWRKKSGTELDTKFSDLAVVNRPCP